MVKLIGLPEALTGKSFVKVSSTKDVFVLFPILKVFKSKLKLKKGRIEGFSPCDG
jgi:hypothetical protein